VQRDAAQTIKSQLAALNSNGMHQDVSETNRKQRSAAKNNNS